MLRPQLIRVGVKNFPPAHGGVEKMAYSTICGLKDEFDITVFTEWKNVLPPPEGIRVVEFVPGVLGKIRQIRAAVRDKQTTIIHFQRETFTPFAIIFSLMGYKVVSSIHGCAWRLKKWGLFYRTVFYILDILVCNIATRTFFVGEADRQSFVKFSFRRLYHIPNGVPLCQLVDKKRTKDMVYVGRMAIEKNLLHIIDEAEKAKRNLDIFGPFDDRHADFREAVLQHLGKSKFAKWLGPISPENLYETLTDYRYFVNVSFAEGMPTAVLEAAACGLNLYLSDILQHRMLMFPDAQYFSPNKFSFPREINEHGFSDKNVQVVKNRYSIDGVIELYRQLYMSLLERK